MSRTQATITALTTDTGTPSTTNNAHSGGDYATPVNASPIGVQSTAQLTVAVTNGSGSAITATIRAAGNGVDTNGNAQPTIQPWDVVLTQATIGDLAVTVGAGATEWIGPFTTGRFQQPDGNLYLDWSATSSTTFQVIQLPYDVA